MDFNINPWEAIAAAFVAWSALRLEIAYRRWRASKFTPKSLAAPAAIPVKGTHTGLAKKITCGNCGQSVDKAVEYTDGDFWCLSCDAFEPEEDASDG